MSQSPEDESPPPPPGKTVDPQEKGPESPAPRERHRRRHRNRLRKLLEGSGSTASPPSPGSGALVDPTVHARSLADEAAALSRAETGPESTSRRHRRKRQGRVKGWLRTVGIPRDLRQRAGVGLAVLVLILGLTGLITVTVLEGWCSFKPANQDFPPDS